MELADWQKIKRESNLEPDEMRSDLKKKGMLPPRTFEEKQLLITSTGMITSYSIYSIHINGIDSIPNRVC